jgi:hypothetical protein
MTGEEGQAHGNPGSKISPRAHLVLFKILYGPACGPVNLERPGQKSGVIPDLGGETRALPQSSDSRNDPVIAELQARKEAFRLEKLDFFLQRSRRRRSGNGGTAVMGAARFGMPGEKNGKAFCLKPIGQAITLGRRGRLYLREISRRLVPERKAVGGTHWKEGPFFQFPGFLTGKVITALSSVLRLKGHAAKLKTLRELFGQPGILGPRRREREEGDGKEKEQDTPFRHTVSHIGFNPFVQ